MRIDWSNLDTELAHWRAAQLQLPIWWRDDDAISQTPALDQLMELSRELGVCVHLAVIPKFADQSLVDAFQSYRGFVPLVHGWAHENHAPPSAKKAEFAHQRPALVDEARMGLDRLRTLFGKDSVEVFVPPWNRIHPELVAELPRLGYKTLSTFTPRQTRFAAPGLLQVNTHIDPINWRGGGGLADPEKLLTQLVSHLKDRREGRADATEPLGILTHHLVHDADIWTFTRDCISHLLDGGAEAVTISSKDGAVP